MSNFASESGHWYDRAGNPAYTIISKNGRERPTTLADARKLNLAPSVSAILGVIDKPQLTEWIKKQIAFTCHSTPLFDGEDCEAYASRILKLYREEGVAKKALDAGSDIHACIEKRLRGEPFDEAYTAHVNGAIEVLETWCGCDGISIEKSFSHPLGYGGKCDLHKPGFLADYKGKDFDETWVPAIYENHWMQLAAYREGFKQPHARCAIIYVSRSVPGLSRLVEVPQEDLEHGWELFKALLKVWQLKNRYIPVFETRKGTEDGQRERIVAAL